MRLRSVLYPQSQAFNDDFMFTVKAQTGSRFCGCTSDFHGYPFSVHGYYEWRHWAVATAVCSSGDTIIEIGANVGTETVGFRDIVGQPGCVFAFEPVPANVEALRQLAALNEWENVEILPYALGDRETRLKFALPPNKHASGVGHVLTNNATATGNTIVVECRPLDTLADHLGAARAIFCDAEGAETMILRGAQHYLDRHQPVVVLEASPKLLRRAGSSREELYQVLQSLGYEIHGVARLGLRPIRHPDQAGAGNWFCVPDAHRGLARKCSAAIARCGLTPCVRGLNPICR